MPANNRDRDTQIIALIDSGVSRIEAARRFGLCRSRISQIYPTGVSVPPLSEDEAAEIVRLAKSGLDISTIAARTGRHHTTIRRFALKRGIAIRNGHDHVGQDKRDKAVELVQSGLSYGAVAQRLGITRNVVSGAVDRWKKARRHDGVPGVSQLQLKPGHGQPRHRAGKLHPAPSRV